MAHSNGTRLSVETPRLSDWARWQARQVLRSSTSRPPGRRPRFTLLKLHAGDAPGVF